MREARLRVGHASRRAFFLTRRTGAKLELRVALATFAVHGGCILGAREWSHHQSLTNAPHPANFACKFPCRLAADNARGRWPSTSHKTPPVVPFSTPGLGPATKSTDTLRWSCAHRHWAKTLGHRCTRESWSAWSGGRALHMRRWLTLPTRSAYDSYRFRLADSAERVTRATWCVAVITIVLDHVDNQFSCWQLYGPRGADNTQRGFCGRQRACYDRAAQWRWSQRRAERAGRRFVTRSCVERCYGRLSGGVLCDVPSVAVSGETSATSVDMEGTYVPRVTVAQKC